LKSFKEHLVELHKTTLGNYIKKASLSYAHHRQIASHNVGSGRPDLHVGKSIKRHQGLEKAVEKLTKENWQATPNDPSDFHETAYHHHMEKHVHHFTHEHGDFEQGEFHARAAEHHAEEYHKETGKKIHDPSYGGDSPHVTSHG
jgi:hypothetical protein